MIFCLEESKRVVNDNNRYLKLITANENGIILSHTHAGTLEKAMIPFSFSIMTKLKLKQAITFLKKKDKVKINLFFRGRQMEHLDLGRKVLDKFLAGEFWLT